MRTLGKAMLTAIAEHKNWKQELFTFLRSYRATPHTSTKTPPGDLLFSAGFRTRFPVMSKHPAANQSVVINVADAKRQSKEYADIVVMLSLIHSVLETMSTCVRGRKTSYHCHMIHHHLRSRRSRAR
jgi:hypothetical protein